MMGRVWMIACRDFIATVSAKAFIFGLLLMPVLVALGATFVPRLIRASPGSGIHGQVAIIDRTGSVLPGLRSALASPVAGQLKLQSMPVLSLLERPVDAQPEHEKSWLAEHDSKGLQHLALVVIPTNAVMLAAGEHQYGTYELYVSKNLPDSAEGVIHEGLRRAIVASRLKNKGLDPVDIETSLRVVRPNATLVGAGGERPNQRLVRGLLPAAFAILLFIGVMTGGQALMTSTIEEKSSRVIEVLLSAVSPLELMCGKLLAQFGASLLLLTVYVGLGLLALIQFAAMGFVEPVLLVELALFFAIAYLTYGAMMLTIGAAVNQVSEAQALLGPVMLLLIVPYVLSVVIALTPSSTMSVALSFVPPINTFVMPARLASDAPPPGWQVALTMLVALGFAFLVLWFAAKVFRIGLLMQGKPPDFATLIRWTRMA
jgi:ABC-2 type transport system permease protein